MATCRHPGCGKWFREQAGLDTHQGMTRHRDARSHAAAAQPARLPPRLAHPQPHADHHQQPDLGPEPEPELPPELPPEPEPDQLQHQQQPEPRQPRPAPQPRARACRHPSLLECLETTPYPPELLEDEGLSELVEVLVHAKTKQRRLLLKHLSKPGRYSGTLPFKTLEQFEAWLLPQQVLPYQGRPSCCITVTTQPLTFVWPQDWEQVTVHSALGLDFSVWCRKDPMAALMGLWKQVGSLLCSMPAAKVAADPPADRFLRRAGWQAAAGAYSHPRPSLWRAGLQLPPGQPMV